MEEERVREEIAQIIPKETSYIVKWDNMPEESRDFFRKMAAQILAIKGIRIEADDQNQPEFLTLGNISRLELVNETRKSMLNPDSEGKVWVKVLPKKE